MAAEQGRELERAIIVANELAAKAESVVGNRTTITPKMELEKTAKPTTKITVTQRVPEVLESQPILVESESTVPLLALVLPEVVEPILLNTEYEALTGREAAIAAWLSDEFLPWQPEVKDQGMSEPEPILLPALKLDWAIELTKEPLELYDDFVVALTAMVGLSETGSEISLLEQQLADSTKTDEQQVLPPIIMTLAEHMSELEPAEKELVVPIVQNIVGAVHGLKLLEARDADPQSIAGVEVQLRELCVTLFEALGIEYSEQDIAQFMSVLLHRPLPVETAAEQTIDLEHTGMHNAKSFADFPFYVSGVTQPLHHILGIFTLLSAVTGRQHVSLKPNMLPN